MLQLSVIVILVVSMFVGRVSPVLQKEGHENIKDDVVANSKNITHISSNNSTKPAELPIKTAEDKEGKINETNISTTTSKSPQAESKMNATTPVSVQKPVKKEKQNCTSASEQVDMRECNVSPHDDDDLIEQNLPLSTTEPTITTTTTVSKKTEVSTESQIPKVTPAKDKEDGGKMQTEVILNSTQATDYVTYDTVSVKTEHLLNKSDISNTNSSHSTNTSGESIAPPLLANKAAASTDSQGFVESVKSADTVNNKRMPSGVIALVIAISFAVAIALVYIGMIVWRRYIEYRYGHRELLVNELEFDTNDLRHFEL